MPSQVFAKLIKKEKLLEGLYKFSVEAKEIVDVAKKMPGVADCGVIPMADQFKGNVPKIFVLMEIGSQFASVAIRTFLANNLEPYKVPVYIEEIDQIPRSYNGKLLRKELIHRR